MRRIDSYDYAIIGAGAAGCVLANRLSADPAVSVLLIEAGGSDRHPFYHVPKAVLKAMARLKGLWLYENQAEPGTGGKVEPFIRGRILGGSTQVNGMMYVRGQPADFDAIAARSSDDWSWPHIGAAYKALESHELGADETRGDGGPLRVSLPPREVRGEIHDRIIAAGVELGLAVKQDTNEPDDAAAIGFNPGTVWRGRRQSAATAFIRPIRKRRNLTILTDAVVDRVIFEGVRATSVSLTHKGRAEIVKARREVLLSAGAIASPGVLERSGVGDPARLAELGIPLVAASPEVGEGLTEHRGIQMQWRLKDPVHSYNQRYRGLPLVWNTIRYGLTRGGVMATAIYDLGAWLRSEPSVDRPDIQLLIAPSSFDFTEMAPERWPGMSLVVYPLRPTSKGSVHITSTEMAAPPRINHNFRTTEQDRRAMVGGMKAVRRLLASDALAPLVAEETTPGAAYATDEEILTAYDTFGTCGYHSVGSCRMGADANSVVDPELRVRGVEGLRVVDASIFPVMPSGNTNGPTMAMAWRAADIITRGQ